MRKTAVNCWFEISMPWNLGDDLWRNPRRRRRAFVALCRTGGQSDHLLGHSSIAITGDVYGQTSDDTACEVAEGHAARPGL
jgi:integrase